MSDNEHDKEQTEQSSLEAQVVSPEVEPKVANIPIGNAALNLELGVNTVGTSVDVTSEDMFISGGVSYRDDSFSANTDLKKSLDLASSDVNIDSSLQYDNSGLSGNASFLYESDDFVANSNLNVNRDVIGLSLSGTNDDKTVLESMDNLLDQDYHQKQQLLANDKSTFSVASRIGYDFKSDNLTQATSVMYKFKGKEKPTFLQLKEETGVSDYNITGVYDNPNLKGKYQFAKTSTEESSTQEHHVVGQLKTNSVQILGNVDVVNLSNKIPLEKNKLDKTTYAVTLHTNRTEDLNFKQGLYTQNDFSLTTLNGKASTMSFNNQIGYSSFGDDERPYGFSSYINTEYTRDFQENGTRLYGRVGSFFDNNNITAEAYFGGEYSTNNIETSHTVFAQAMGFYRAGNNLNANTVISYDNTFTNNFIDGGKRVQNIKLSSGLEYKAGNNVSFNGNVEYNSGVDKRGWSGNIGARIMF